jgi:flagellar biosynthesis anti-sigma factor FlgM
MNPAGGLTLERIVKIDGNRSTADINGTDGARKIAADRGTQRANGRTAVDKQDKVEVSADAQLLTAALKATNNSPEIRTDVVERMRQKLAAGELGSDSGRLADRLIDDLLKP